VAPGVEASSAAIAKILGDNEWVWVVDPIGEAPSLTGVDERGFLSCD
jgi:hypothetical protein